jgi:hypothetical protein
MQRLTFASSTLMAESALANKLPTFSKAAAKKVRRK